MRERTNSIGPDIAVHEHANRTSNPRPNFPSLDTTSATLPWLLHFLAKLPPSSDDPHFIVR